MIYPALRSLPTSGQVQRKKTLFHQLKTRRLFVAEFKTKKSQLFVGIFKQNKLKVSIFKGSTLFFHHLHSTVLYLAQPGLSVESVWLR